MRQYGITLMLLLAVIGTLGGGRVARADQPALRRAFQAYIMQRFDRNRDGVIDGADWRLFSKRDKYFLVMNDLMTLDAILSRGPNASFDESQLKHMTYECVFGLDAYYQNDAHADESVISLVAKVYNAECP